MIRESSNWGLDISEFHKGHLWTVSCGVVYLRHVFVKGNAGRVLPKLPDTFDSTLTTSPVPLRVGLRCGMGLSVINNIGRRWEAKEHCGKGKKYLFLLSQSRQTIDATKSVTTFLRNSPVVEVMTQGASLSRRKKNHFSLQSAHGHAARMCFGFSSLSKAIVFGDIWQEARHRCKSRLSKAGWVTYGYARCEIIAIYHSYKIFSCALLWSLVK